MTKEELVRIESAYHSGLKVKIWFNGYWQDFDHREYPDGGFSERRQYCIVGSGYAEKAEKRIKELEKELEKKVEQIEALNKDKDYFSDALDKQIEATLKLHKENTDLKNLIKNESF